MCVCVVVKIRHILYGFNDDVTSHHYCVQTSACGCTVTTCCHNILSKSPTFCHISPTRWIVFWGSWIQCWCEIRFQTLEIIGCSETFNIIVLFYYNIIKYILLFYKYIEWYAHESLLVRFLMFTVTTKKHEAWCKHGVDQKYTNTPSHAAKHILISIYPSNLHLNREPKVITPFKHSINHNISIWPSHCWHSARWRHDQCAQQRWQVAARRQQFGQRKLMHLEYTNIIGTQLGFIP